MRTEMEIFLTFGGSLILMMLLGKALLVPLKILLKILINSVLGGLLLVVINFIGSPFGVFIPVNVINSAVAGILGVPGVILLFIFCL